MREPATSESATSESAKSESAKSESATPIPWTDAQRAGITTVGTGLLVPAAAGSGKTAVLAERCAYLVCDAPPPHRCDVDELLVLTFTRPAAAEMRHRIDAAIRRRIAAAPREGEENDAERERLAAQLLLIDRAQVSTLHTFCSRLLRRHFQRVGLDPNFTLLDEEEANLLRRDVARALFDGQYDGGGADAFADLIDRWSNENDAALIERVIALHELLTSVPDPERWRADAAARVREAAGSAVGSGKGSGGLEETALGRVLAGALAEELRGLLGRCDRASETAGRVAGLEKYVAHLAGLRPVIERWLGAAEAGELAALAGAVAGFEPGKQHKAPTITNPPAEKGVVYAEIKSIKEAMRAGAVAELCRLSAAEWRATMAEVADPTALLLDLAGEFGRRYDAAKGAMRAVDFADLERLALRLLTDPAARVAESLHREFRHVLVDEYQDINAVQDELLARMSTGDNLFRVGDVKQSIYRFRLAEPARFLALYDGLRRGEVAGGLIPLSANFRSRGPLLEVVNRTFGMLMTEAAAEIDYADGHALVAGLDYGGAPGEVAGRAFAGAPVELHLLPKGEDARGGGPDGGDGGDGGEEGEEGEEADGPAEGFSLDGTEREAAVVAGRLRALMGLQGGPARVVLDPKGGYRPMRWGDAAVLLRATARQAEQYAAVLRRCGVPVHADAKSGFFDAVEVRDVIALLRVLDNRRQDVPLAAVLRGPLAGWSGGEDALARVRLAYPSRAVPFFEAVARYAGERSDDLAAALRRVLADLDRWRDLARRRPLAELLWSIYTDTGYLAYAAGLAGGEQRAANLAELHRRAEQFGTFQRQGLSRFLAFLDQLDDAGDLGQASAASEADDVVRVMSIHRAKGLEFPIVALSNLGKRHNTRSATGPVLFDRALGVGLDVIDGERHLRYPSLASLLVGRAVRRQAAAEELRVLYVAMTRAREHLICVGSSGEGAAAGWRAKWAGHAGPMPAADVLGGGSFLDWLGPVAAAAGGFEIVEHDAAAVEAAHEAMSVGGGRGKVDPRLAALRPLADPPALTDDAAAVVAAVVARFERRYDFQPFTTLPAARSVTGGGTGGGTEPAGVEAHAPQLDLPRFFAESRRQTAAEAGSAVHVALQHLDFSQPCDAADVRRQVAALVDRRLLTAVAAKGVDADALAWLMTTPVGALLREHQGEVRRELAVFVPDDDLPDDSADPMDRPMVRGRVDALIPTSGGPVLVDYKTDRLGPGEVAARAEGYRPQVAAYRAAVERITGRAVAGAHLVFLTAREVVSL